MKKTYLSVILLTTMLVFPVNSLAYQNQNQNQTQNQAEIETNIQNQDKKTGLTVQSQVELNKKNREELKETIKEKSQELKQFADQIKNNLKTIYQNQQKSQLAVHAFLALAQDEKNLNQNMLQSAQQIQQKIQNTILNEEKIQTRNWLTRLFLGTDQETITALESDVTAIKTYIEKLQTDLEQYDTETQQMYDQYVIDLNEEMNRLQAATKEQKLSHGILGWFIDIFK